MSRSLIEVMRDTSRVSAKIIHDVEKKWAQRWKDNAEYTFRPRANRAEVFSLDAPIPTISGFLHLGSIFGSAHSDVLARYNRMQGREVLFPIGWDDNGLPTERLVERHFGVRCDPSLPFDPDFVPPGPVPPGEEVLCGRRNFLELCQAMTEERGGEFDEVWTRLGFSVDWSRRYTTIDRRAQRVSQRAFVRDLARGNAYQAEGPVYWDSRDATGLAQAEIEQRDVEMLEYPLRFFVLGEDEHVEVRVTRPELLPAAVALATPVAGPHGSLVGSTVVSPLFGVELPVVAHQLPGDEPVLVCTFANSRDIAMWRKFALPTRTIITRDRRLADEVPAWLPESGHATYKSIAGLPVEDARQECAQLLSDEGHLLGEPTTRTLSVEFGERSDRPIEIVTSIQWYIKNGSHDAELHHRLEDGGRQLEWIPKQMQRRFDAWLGEVDGDWLISRQRFLGVAFPVWYPVDDDGEIDRAHPIVAEEVDLPVVPWDDVPRGYSESQRGQPGGFVAETDVMDTFVTSSLTPQIVCQWEEDPDFFASTFPMDIRTQGAENIRTWIFYTMLRSFFHHDVIPWTSTLINGWVLETEHGKGAASKAKMSKSKGNIVPAKVILEEFGADALRYWACASRPGMDVGFSTERIKVGQRVIRRLWSLSEFALGVGCQPVMSDTTAVASEVVDCALLARLSSVVDDATRALDACRYANALRAASDFLTELWRYTDLVGHRAGGDVGVGRDSALAALSCSLSVTQRLFAPFMPFVSEEVWSWWCDGSVHRAPWPSAPEVERAGAEQHDTVFETATTLVRAIRRARATHHLPEGGAHGRFVVRAPGDHLAVVECVAEDVRRAGALEELVLVERKGDDIEHELLTR